jgi:hypothetical protein
LSGWRQRTAFAPSRRVDDLRPPPQDKLSFTAPCGGPRRIERPGFAVTEGYLPQGLFIEVSLVPETFELTREQLDEFERRGVARLQGFYPQVAIGSMADCLWADLEKRYGMRRDRPESWTVTSPTGFQALRRSGAFNALGSPKAERWSPSPRRPQLCRAQLGTWTSGASNGSTPCPS